MGRISLFAGIWLVSPPFPFSLPYRSLFHPRSPWTHIEPPPRLHTSSTDPCGSAGQFTDVQWTIIRWSTSRPIRSKMVVPRRSINFLYLLNHLGRHQGK